MSEPIVWDDGYPNEFGVPRPSLTLIRLLTTENVNDEDFVPDCDVRQKYGFEDHANYRSFSAYRTQEGAEAAAEEANRGRPASGLEPFRFVTTFSARTKRGHAVAETHAPGHFSVWGPAKRDALNLERPSSDNFSRRLGLALAHAHLDHEAHGRGMDRVVAGVYPDVGVGTHRCEEPPGSVGSPLGQPKHRSPILGEPIQGPTSDPPVVADVGHGVEPAIELSLEVLGV